MGAWDLERKKEKKGKLAKIMTETKHDVLTVTPMGVFLVIPDGDIFAGAVGVDGGTTLRTASLRDAFAGRTSRCWGIQPSEERTSRRVTLPPGRLSGWTRGRALPELLGVLTVGRLEESNRRHLE